MADLRPRHISAIDGAAEHDPSKPLPMLDAGDAASLKTAVKESKTAAEINRETVRNMMLVEANRKWFYNTIAICGILQNPFAGEKPLSMAFACGEMNIGQQIFVQLQDACPDLYMKMMEENNG